MLMDLYTVGPSVIATNANMMIMRFITYYLFYEAVEIKFHLPNITSCDIEECRLAPSAAVLGSLLVETNNH